MIIAIQNTIGAIGRGLGIVTRNLQMWLGFKKADVIGSNQFVLDKSTNTNNAKLFTGKALSFDGVNDYIENSSMLTASKNASTLSFSIKNTGSSGGEGFIGNSTTNQYYLSISSNNLILRASETMVFSYSFSLNTWYRISIVRFDDSGTSKTSIYVDDVLTSTIVNEFDFQFNRFGESTSGSYGQVLLSDIQLYNAAWDSDDAAYDYANPNKLVFDNASSSIVVGDLVGYWALSEGSGSIAYDSSGEGNNGAITGATYDDKQPTIPQLGMMDWRKYMTFDGVDDYVQLSTTTLVGDCSIGFTYNTTSPNGSFLGKASTTVIRYEWYNNDRVIAIIGGNTYVFTITTDLVKDSSSIVFTRVGTLLSLYLEGVFVQSKTVSTSDWVFADARIGYSNWNKFNGLISQAYMFSDALSASEVLAIHNTNTIPTTDLYGHWINSGTDTWLDLSTNSNNGTPSGAAKTITLIQNPNNVGYDGLGNFLRLREGGFNLDGIGYAEVADDDTLDFGTGDFSIECWAKFAFINKGSAWNSIVCLGGGIYRDSSAGLATRVGEFALNVGNSELISTPTLIVGNWYHIVGTRTGSTTRLYIDSVVESLTGTSSQDVTNTLVKMIGDDDDTTTNHDRHYEDLIDDVRLYKNKALSQKEIDNNYKVGLSKHKN